MRITTSSIMRNYKNNLATSASNLNAARTRVLTGRSFNSVAENPAASAIATKLHRKYFENSDQLNMISDAQKRLDSQQDSLLQVSNLAKTIAEEYNVTAMNGTNGELSNRQTYATAIRSSLQTMVYDLNTTYGDSFLFAGSDGKNVPFALADDGTLTYRGVNVDVAQGTADYEKLASYAKDSVYVDLGMGFSLDDSGEVEPSSAYNISVPGISAVGYGKDEDGLSNNAIVLAGQLANLLDAETFDSDTYGKLMDKFKNVSNGITNSLTELGVKSQFLGTTEDRLENVQINLTEQMTEVEQIDSADAITDLSWYKYAYDSALKVGTSLLSGSFIDFMS